MPGFVPSNSNLNQLDEFTNLSHTITYTDLLGVSYPVTITVVDPNPTVTVSGATISGYYTESFTNDIQYKTLPTTFTNVEKFSEIDLSKFDELIYYKADTTPYKDYTYIASANGESKTYTVTVTNNWTNGRDELLRYMKLSSTYTVTSIVWINSTGTSVTWENSSGSTVDWNNL